MDDRLGQDPVHAIADTLFTLHNTQLPFQLIGLRFRHRFLAITLCPSRKRDGTEEKTTSKGVGPQEEYRPLEVIIVGAGIGGLSLGIYLRQNGHRVQVRQQSRIVSSKMVDKWREDFRTK